MQKKCEGNIDGTKVEKNKFNEFLFIFDAQGRQ